MSTGHWSKSRQRRTAEETNQRDEEARKKAEQAARTSAEAGLYAKDVKAVLLEKKHNSHFEDYDRYTRALGWMALILLFATAFQLHSVWKEERMWSLPSSSEWHSHAQWAVNLSLELVENDPEALAIVSAYENLALCDADGEQESCAREGENHYSHPEAVGRVLRSHWQYDLLVYSMLLNCMIYLSLAFRWTFIWMSEKSFRLMIYTSNVNWVSSLAQFFSFSLWLYVALFFRTWLAAFGCLLVGSIVCLEFVSCVILTRMRNCVIWMRSLNPEPRKAVEEALRNVGAEEGEVQDELQKFDSNPMRIFDIFLDVLATINENIQADQLSRNRARKNLSKRKKKL